MTEISSTQLPLTPVSSNGQAITNYLNGLTQQTNSTARGNASIDILNDLDDSLNGKLPTNPDEEAEYQINSWATQRGLTEGSLEFKEFHDTFYNDLYLNTANKKNLNNIQQALNLYDMDLKKRSTLNDYFRLLVNNTTSKQALNLYKFEKSNNFNIVNIEATRKRYIDILVGASTSKQQEVLTEALKTHKVPITGEELTVTNLDKVLSVIDDPKQETRLKLELQAKQFAITFDSSTNKSVFSQTKFDEYMNKFYSNYYLDKGLKFEDLTQLTSLFKSIKVKYPQTNFNEIDAYADAIKNKVPLSFIKTVLALDIDPSYRGNISDRNANINTIFNKFQTGNNSEKAQLEKKLKETVTKLQDERSATAVIEARTSNFAFQDSALGKYVKDSLTNWKNTYKLNGTQLTQITNLALNQIAIAKRSNGTITDQEKIKFFNDASVYVAEFAQGLRYEDALKIQNFEYSPIFNLTGQAKENKLKQYLQLMRSDDQERKNRFLISIRFNTIYPSSQELALMKSDPTITYQSLYPNGRKLTLSSLDQALGLG